VIKTCPTAPGATFICSGRGTCDGANGACNCHVGYTSGDCAQCSYGYRSFGIKNGRALCKPVFEYKAVPTPNPTVSPTQAPTLSPTNSPTKSPTALQFPERPKYDMTVFITWAVKNLDANQFTSSVRNGFASKYAKSLSIAPSRVRAYLKSEYESRATGGSRHLASVTTEIVIEVDYVKGEKNANGVSITDLLILEGSILSVLRDVVGSASLEIEGDPKSVKSEKFPKESIGSSSSTEGDELSPGIIGLIAALAMFFVGCGMVVYHFCGGERVSGNKNEDFNQKVGGPVNLANLEDRLSFQPNSPPNALTMRANPTQGASVMV